MYHLQVAMLSNLEDIGSIINNTQLYARNVIKIAIFVIKRNKETTNYYI